VQGGDLVALFQGQVPIVHVQLHWPVKRRKLRHLARFNSRKLHFAIYSTAVAERRSTSIDVETAQKNFLLFLF